MFPRVERKRVYTLEQCKERIEVWQGRLGLTDWVIDCEFADQKGFQENASGEIWIYAFSKQALIKVPSPETYSNSVFPEQDMESLIVHELIHIFFDVITPERASAKNLLFEQGINGMTQAMTKAYEDIEALEVVEPVIEMTDFQLQCKAGVSAPYGCESGQLILLGKDAAKHAGGKIVRIIEDDDETIIKEAKGVE